MAKNKQDEWDIDRWQWAKDRIRWLSIACAGFFIISVSEGIGIGALLPLKEFVPEIHIVDKSTGIVDVYKKPELGIISERENVTEGMMKRYIRLREEYAYETAQESFDRTNFFNDEAQTKIYSDYASPSINKFAPTNVYGNKANIKIQFKNCTKLTDYSNVWMCRYLQQVNWKDGKEPEISHWSSTVTFKVLGFPSTQVEREFNPFGISVNDYKHVREDVPVKGSVK
jgi:type IV secretion system protein VirB8